MSRRHRRQSGAAGPTLNLAAMLDMAFQLLSFFVLTYNPPPLEYAVGLKLPKAEKVATPEKPANDKPGEGPTPIEQVVVAVVAGADGTIAQLGLNGNATATGLGDLQAKMQAQVTAADGGIERVLIEVDPKLKMSEFAAVLERCLQLKLPNGQKLSKVSPVMAKPK